MDLVGHGIRLGIAWKYQANDDVIAILHFVRNYAGNDAFVLLSDTDAGKVASGELGLVEPGVDKPYLNLGDGILNKYYWSTLAKPSLQFIAEVMDTYEIRLVFFLVSDYWVFVKQTVSLDSLITIETISDRYWEFRSDFDDYTLAVFDKRPLHWKDTSLLENHPIEQSASSWVLSNDTLSQLDPLRGWADVLLSNQTFSIGNPVTLEAKMEVTSYSGGHLGILFGYKDILTHYYAFLREYSLHLYERVNETGIEVLSVSLPGFSLGLNVPHALSVKLDGQQIALFVDGEYKASYLAGRSLDGLIGLRTHFLSATYSSFDLLEYS